ncbi:hypothetical protein ERX37_07150 [Macrococcus hajekii]|uniref:AraC-type arabinose-binding/dimerisation domain-containing protein n=1 Tax=Macrococcus hajekii TaxID=198482 RepID=A0A4R6BJV4_9STAP|nr:hypothetical protein [Macrococcus hajekii]TDM01978.1 hypothetical protein ERX37_07150 [Macrococcus hajekii]GGB09003.1 hypothetical protein GCM10007190_16320 [Macrococcus hajekii]
MNYYHIDFNSNRLRTLSKSNGVMLLFILKGEMICSIDNQKKVYEAGDIILLNHHDSYMISQPADDYMTLQMTYQFVLGGCDVVYC